MHNRLACFLAFFFCTLLMGSFLSPVYAQVSNPSWGDQGNGTYKNPVLMSDYSDPDVIRVGSDFYMVASDFHFWPNIPILHSKDLVNWTIISHVLPDTTNFTSIYPSYEWSGYGRGVWAPSIRFHAGRYYIYYPLIGYGIYMTSATSPTGPWTTPVLVKADDNATDPCPFWDEDGKAYLVHAVMGGTPLWMYAMSPDGTTLTDQGRVVFTNQSQFNALEGPKMYKRNGYYYIFAPYGGVETGPQAVLRSQSVFGPYEARTVLRAGNGINGPHQGGWVELASGENWFMHFQQLGGYGRITHLQPMKWVNDWPVIGSDPENDGTGIPVLSSVKPNVGAVYPISLPATSDEFSQSTLGKQWQWNFNPIPSKWSLTDRPGYLRIKNNKSTGGFSNTKNILTQKIMGFINSGTTEIDVSGMVSNQTTGIGILGEPHIWIGVVQTGTTRQIKMSYTNSWRGGSGSENGPTITGNTVWLRAEVLSGGMARVSYSTNGTTFTPLGSDLQMYFSYWKGMKYALFSWNTQTETGVADFNWFRYTHDGPIPGASTPPTTATPTPTASSCAEDITRDGIIDLSDYSVLAANFLKAVISNPAADINKDGIVDVSDYSLLARKFLQPCP